MSTANIEIQRIRMYKNVQPKLLELRIINTTHNTFVIFASRQLVACFPASLKFVFKDIYEFPNQTATFILNTLHKK